MSAEIAFYETLKKVIACIDNGDRQLLSRFGLTVPRYYALKHIHENPGVSLTTLSALMYNDKSSATRLTRSMQEEGLVRRRRSESDRRAYHLYLSESGKQLLQRASAARDIYTLDRFSDIDVDVEALAGDLVVIIDSLEGESKLEK
jgi:DNA-binding MarR family transcriptional regulator